MRKTALICCLLLTAALLCGAAAAEDRVFVDSIGREVLLPADVTNVAPSGSLAQISLYPFGEEYYVSISSALKEGERHFLSDRLDTLPVTGSMFGSKATMNPEEIIALDKKIGIDVIIDVGEPKGNMKEQMDDVQGKSGVPFVFITQSTLDSIAQSYITLGEMLGQEEKGEELAEYFGGIVSMYEENMEKIGDNKVSAIYVTKLDGNSVNLLGHNSYHAEILDGIAENIVPEAVAGSGLGDQYTMEDIYQMNPDYIIVAGSGLFEHDYYEEIMSSSMWAVLDAVKEGRVIEVPAESPWSWMGNPPAAHRLVSILWLGNVFYPDVFDYDLEEEVKEFYKVFYNYELSNTEISEMMKYSTGNAEQTASSPVPVIGVLAGLGAAILLRKR